MRPFLALLFALAAIPACTCGPSNSPPAPAVSAASAASSAPLLASAPASASAAPAPGPFLAVEIALASWSTCLRSQRGEVRCLGIDNFGQRGDGTHLSPHAPPHPAIESGAKRLGLGSFFGCAILENAQTRCWGNMPPFAPRKPGAAYERPPILTTATSIPELSGIVELVGAYSEACARTAKGRILCWGSENDPRTQDDAGAARPIEYDNIADALQITITQSTRCALLANGSVQCLSYRRKPGADAGWEPHWQSVEAPAKVRAIAAGTNHTCLVLEDGRLACWGKNDAGQLGDGTTEERQKPVLVPGLSKVRAAALGDEHSCALLEDGKVRCWGANYLGQLGHGKRSYRSLEPVFVADLESVKQIDAGAAHTCALSDSGAVRCWGKNDVGQLGDGTTFLRRTPASVKDIGPLPPPAPVPSSLPEEKAGECPRARRVDFDPSAWKSALEKAESEDQRAELLAKLGLDPVPDDDKAAIECEHRPTLEGIDLFRGHLSDDPQPELMIQARYASCGEPSDPGGGTTTQRIRILRPIGEGAYCMVEPAFNVAQSREEGPCMPHPTLPEGSLPVVFGFFNLTDAKRKSLRMDAKRGLCAGYPRESTYETVFYDLEGFELVKRFEAVTFEETHSVAPGPWKTGEIKLLGGFPKEISLSEEQHCEEPEEGQEQSCTPSKKTTVYKLKDGSYRAP